MCAETATESTAVGDAYAVFVAELRKVAGTAMCEAWLAEPTTDDIPPEVIDFCPPSRRLSRR